MEGNKIFIPPPPKELKKMPPLPPNLRKVEEESVDVEKDDSTQLVLKTNQDDKVDNTTQTSDIDKGKPEVFATPSSNEVFADSVVEKDDSASNVLEKGKVETKTKNQKLKTAFYWVGFICSLTLVGVLIFLLVL